VTQGVAVADRVHCLLEGRTSLVGVPSELTSQQIDRAYFGADLAATTPGVATS
jgi:branched-chain amino acid transport system ATP-binding protein